MPDDASDLHDFMNRRWRKPLVREEEGKWLSKSGGAYSGEGIEDDPDGIYIEDSDGVIILADPNATPTSRLAPALMFAPIVTGIPTQGQTLSTTPGVWTQNPAFYYYQWLRDGVAISGATATTYTLVSGDVGHLISVEVRASNNVGVSPPGFSRPAGPIAATFTASATPVTTAAAFAPYAGFTVSVSGGWPPYLFNLIAGYWPPGITMNGETGVVSGVAQYGGTFANITIQVRERYGQIITLAPFTLTVSGDQPLQIQTGEFLYASPGGALILAAS